MTVRRVLVVDDDEAIREVAKLSLEVVGGYRALTAASGQEGIDLAERERPDAILLDVTMPALDGPATLRRLQSCPATRDIAVLLLTATAQARGRTSVGALPGVAGVLPKPFDPLQLPGQVADLLGWVT